MCDSQFKFSYGATVPQAQLNSDWVTEQLKTAIHRAGETPDALQVFRPQAVSLLKLGGESLGIRVEPTRQTPTLHRWLVQRTQWYPSLEGHTGAGYDPPAFRFTATPTPAGSTLGRTVALRRHEGGRLRANPALRTHPHSPSAAGTDAGEFWFAQHQSFTGHCD